MQSKALIVDFGAERLDLLTAALNKFNIPYTVLNHGFDLVSLNVKEYSAVILSGSLSCSYLDDAPDIDDKIFDLGLPVLGICYGMQITTLKFGGKVEKSPVPEFGETPITFYPSKLFGGLNYGTVYMTHYDYVTKIPCGFKVTAKTKDCPVAALESQDKNIYLVQFHPEFFVAENDTILFENFFFNICGFQKSDKN